MNSTENNERQTPESRFLENRDVLFAYIRAHVRNWTDAEDLFQETAMVALRKFREGVEVQNMGAWSREIARRTILDHWKKGAKRGLVFTEEALDAIENVFAETDGADDRAADKLDALTTCLEKLPGHLRELVDLFYKEKMSLERIGRQLNRSAGAVQVSLSRTRRTLLECVEQIGAEGRVRS